MKRALVPASTPVALAALVLALGACGGDDDDDAAADSTTTTSSSVVTSATQPSTTSTTAAPATPTTAPPGSAPAYVTEGAVVIVANASRVNGAAGRMSERLAAAGFEMAEPTDSSEGPLETTKVYYNASVPEAQAVAQSVVAALGGGSVVLEPLPTPAPLDNPDAIGLATVLVAMGGDTADKSLEELQGLEPPADETDDTTADSSAPPTSGA